MGLMGASGLSARKIIDLIYPVGSIYTSANNVSPETLFGGTWEQIQGKFMLTSGNGYSLGATGGEAAVTLNINQIPSHRHNGITTRWVEPAQFGPSCGPEGGSNFTVTKDNGSSGYYTNYTGGGQAHNNMPPYIVVNAWKRTA